MEILGKSVTNETKNIREKFIPNRTKKVKKGTKNARNENHDFKMTL